jgi:ArsR family transcriptional regulator, arsenate/arsenite/antimonite-responsive transcriptional repressor
MPGKDAKKILAVFKALADETRLHIVHTVAFAGQCGTVECAKGLDLSQPTLSHHIKILIDANILFVEKNGTTKKYSLNSKYLEELGVEIKKNYE